jgi:two-component system nitrogen regulation response regulator GlnG/two-component system response regulator HydG
MSKTAADAALDTQSIELSRHARSQDGVGSSVQLVLLWSRNEPERIGETCVVARDCSLGRGPAAEGDPPRAEMLRQRPSSNEPTGDLADPTLSRRQWLLKPQASGLEVKNLGRRPLLHNGITTDSCRASIGDTLVVEEVALFLVARRPRLFVSAAAVDFEFGEPDAVGMVGESPEAWQLRAELEYVGKDGAPVMIFGPSGSGKELCARALHRASRRSTNKWLARNAATIPAGLVEAELFGNAANYPHAGMPARSGLVGAADGGTLFLDEIGELGEAQQANLLRLLDSGEYQRLGEDKLRHADVRMIGATNRPPASLKADVLARFTERVEVPGLNDRASDIPFLARNILARLSQEEQTEPLAMSLELTEALVRHRYSLHHRELERLLRLARRASKTSELELAPAVEAELDIPVTMGEPSADAIRQALQGAKSAGDAAKRLGLPSRFALYRLMKKFGIEQKPSSPPSHGADGEKEE